MVSFLLSFTQEIRQYITHSSYTNPVKLENNTLAWWKQHGHLFPTLSQLARRYLTTPDPSCPVERLFSVADASRRANLLPNNLIFLVFMHEALPFLRKIRAHRIVQETVGVCTSSFYLDLDLSHIMKSEAHYPFCTCALFTGTIKNTVFCPWYHSRPCVVFQKKNCG